MINSTGITRIVFVFKTFVIKIPNFRYSFQHFLKGLIGNINESQTWKYNRHRPEILEMICPVLWCSWGGWVLIMKRADVDGYIEWIKSLPPLPEGTDLIEHNKMFYSKWINAGLGGDDKADNYGFLKGNVVKIDYAQ